MPSNPFLAQSSLLVPISLPKALERDRKLAVLREMEVVGMTDGFRWIESELAEGRFKGASLQRSL